MLVIFFVYEPSVDGPFFAIIVDGLAGFLHASPNSEGEEGHLKAVLFFSSQPFFYHFPLPSFERCAVSPPGAVVAQSFFFFLFFEFHFFDYVMLFFLRMESI